jgi:hypothetical protein
MAFWISLILLLRQLRPGLLGRFGGERLVGFAEESELEALAQLGLALQQIECAAALLSSQARRRCFSASRARASAR